MELDYETVRRAIKGDRNAQAKPIKTAVISILRLRPLFSDVPMKKRRTSTARSTRNSVLSQKT